MKLTARERLTGLESPVMYLAKRVIARGGKEHTGRVWQALYFDGHRNRIVSLKTGRKHDAFKAAIKLHERVSQGEAAAEQSPITVEQLVHDYLQMLEARGRAPKTISKYSQVLRDFVTLCGKGDVSCKRERSPRSTTSGIGSGPPRKG